MKTHKCRPVLLPTDNKHSQLEIDDLTVGKLSYELKQYHHKNPQQLILISLEDDKIEVGDTLIDSDLKTSFELFSPYEEGDIAVDKFYKVIVTQEKLPPEYIQQFIEEYNKGEVKDVVIEMEEIKDTTDRAWYNTCLCRNIIQPKLNNGFVTIIVKSDIEKQADIVEEIGFKVLNPTQTSYTEKEVKELLQIAFKAGHERGYSGYPNTNNWTKPEFEEWFEQNKKK